MSGREQAVGVQARASGAAEGMAGGRGHEVAGPEGALWAEEAQRKGCRTGGPFPALGGHPAPGTHPTPSWSLKG